MPETETPFRDRLQARVEKLRASYHNAVDPGLQMQVAPHEFEELAIAKGDKLEARLAEILESVRREIPTGVVLTIPQVEYLLRNDQSQTSQGGQPAAGVPGRAKPGVDNPAHGGAT